MTIFFSKRIATLLALAIACAVPQLSARVITGTPLIAHWVEYLTDGRVEATAFIPAGSSLHTFEPTPQQMTLLEGAEAVILADEDEARYLRRYLQAARVLDDRIRIVDATEGGQHWNRAKIEPAGARIVVASLATILLAEDPSLDSIISFRLADLVVRLNAMQTKMEALFDEIDTTHRVLAVNHSGLEPFSEHQEFRLIELHLHGESASPRQLAEAATRLRASRARFLLAEASHVTSVDRALAREAGIPLEPIHLDTLIKGDFNDPYRVLLRTNLSAILLACTGEVPKEAIEDVIDSGS